MYYLDKYVFYKNFIIISCFFYIFFNVCRVLKFWVLNIWLGFEVMEFSLVLFILDLILIVIIVVFIVFSRLVCVKVVVLLVDVLLVRMMMNREELECVLLVDRMLCFWMYCSVFFVWVDFLMLFVC